MTKAQRIANFSSGNTDIAIIDSEPEITVCVYGDMAVVQNLDCPPLDRSANRQNQNGYCLTFDLSIATQLSPARPCGVSGILFKLR